ncbi:DNA alkylation repair protein, partial [Candidatus Venteria ishoeyi]|uniref:DNA alkylation repair protein n=1 Tax=Candidatus Venteria ishoeyi TaxID=1899563 RepID=UPI0011B0D368
MYSKGKVIGLVCNDQLFIKQTDAGKKYIGNYAEGIAYPGAKPSLLIEDKIEDKEWLSKLILITEKEIPVPKKKKKILSKKVSKNNSPVTQHLQKLADSKIAEHSQNFFKTGKGEYGEGDIFLGIRVPELRKIAKKNITTKDSEIVKLLKNKYHEIRLTGLFIWVYQFQKADNVRQKEIFDFYIKHLESVNNWDLVDTTTPHIIGRYLVSNPIKNREFLYIFAESKNLWERRIAIIATHAL